ncbi:hypothetical protein CsSME_00000616 [Camellia sinensis var. sinensis]
MDLVSTCKEILACFRVKELKDVLMKLGLSTQGKKQLSQQCPAFSQRGPFQFFVFVHLQASRKYMVFQHVLFISYTYILKMLKLRLPCVSIHIEKSFILTLFGDVDRDLVDRILDLLSNEVRSLQIENIAA